MESITDLNVESARIQKEIESHLGLNGVDLIFELSQLGQKTKLDLITVNPRHNQSFLFHSTQGVDKVDAYQKLLDYVKSYKEKEGSYTIQWAMRGSRELNTSYFRAGNIYEALDKLYFSRDMNTITVFSVVLNPIS